MLISGTRPSQKAEKMLTTVPAMDVPAPQQSMKALNEWRKLLRTIVESLLDELLKMSAKRFAAMSNRSVTLSKWESLHFNQAILWKHHKDDVCEVCDIFYSNWIYFSLTKLKDEVRQIFTAHKRRKSSYVLLWSKTKANLFINWKIIVNSFKSISSLSLPLYNSNNIPG